VCQELEAEELGIEGGRGSDRVRRDGIDTGRDWEREREEIMVVVWMEG
jgi:hypothetical protein